MKAALVHDLPEAATSDIPGPAKRAIADDSRVTRVESDYISLRFPDYLEAWRTSKQEGDIRSLIKAADLIDELVYLQTEKQLGNSSVGHFYKPTTPMGNSYSRLKRVWTESSLLNDSGIWEDVFKAIQANGEGHFSNILID